MGAHHSDSVQIRHGAEQYTGYLEFILNGYDLDSAIPRMSDAANCLTPSLVQISDTSFLCSEACVPCDSGANDSLRGHLQCCRFSRNTA